MRLATADGREIARPLPPAFVPSGVSPGVATALFFNAWTLYGLLALISGVALYAFLREAMFGPAALLVACPAVPLFCIGLAVAVRRARWLRRTRKAEGVVVDIHVVVGGAVGLGVIAAVGGFGSGGSSKPSRRYVFRLGAIGEEPWGANFYARFGKLRGISVGDAVEVAYDVCFPLRILPLLWIPARPSFNEAGNLHLSQPAVLLAYVAFSLCIVAGSAALLLL